MVGIEKLTVFVNFDDTEIEVGELALVDRKIHFKYASEFIKSGIQLSPFKLPLKSGIHTAHEIPFDGLHGLFSDSLPDGWGRLLLDRSLAAKGVNIKQINPLDRLTYIGDNGMGALAYMPKHAYELDFDDYKDLDTVFEEINHVINGSSDEIIESLFQIGGSPGGARPKILVGYHPQTKQLIYGQKNLPEGYEHWLVKFASKEDLPDIAEIEFAYFNMVKAAGIEMEKCRLFKGNSGKHYFGTKRFDRKDGNKFHTHTAAGLLDDNFRYSNLDYGHLMDTAFRLEKDVAAYAKILRLAAFNVFAHNRDDHSKNFSFIMNKAGEWKLAPAYDITFSSSSHGMHSTLIAGEGKNPGRKHLLELGDAFNVKNAKQIIEEVATVVSNWKTYAQTAGVSKKSIQLIANITSELTNTTN